MLAGLPDMIKGFKKNKIYVSYTFYDANQQLISTKKIEITKNTNEIVTDKAIKEGYVKVMLISNSKSFYFKNIIINSKDPAEDYSGGVANTMDLTTGADCMGDGGGLEDPGDGSCESNLKAALKKCDKTYDSDCANCDKKYPNSWWDRWGCKISAWSACATCKDNAYIIYDCSEY